MTREDILTQQDDVMAFIDEVKYKLRFVDKRKLSKVKKICRKYDETQGNQMQMHVPMNIATYNTLIDIQIKKIVKDIYKEYNDLPIQRDSTDISCVDAIGYSEMILSDMSKMLKRSFFINYKNYKKYMRRDKSGAIGNNFEKIYSLQKDKVVTNLDFVIAVYRMLPNILKTIKTGGTDVV